MIFVTQQLKKEEGMPPPTRPRPVMLMFQLGTAGVMQGSGYWEKDKYERK